MSTTYNDLVSNIKSWSGRTDSQTINAIPQFIAAAQTKLDGELKISAMSKSATYNTDTTSVDVSEFMTIDSITVAGLVGTATTYADITALRVALANRPELAGYDFHYATNGNSIELVRPAPLTITGYQKPPRISQGVQTNAYTDSAENALLWYSLAYCAMFSRDSDAANSWSAMADKEVQELNAIRDQFQKTGTAKVKRRGYF
ncbi:hypothetical protein [Citrobacter sp. Marseille-Q6884]|uniref:phage adaptor protein n=1 Tax=Citrobacter sp. Marseille-Q6884 TaxID=2956786 RepID=UPI0021B40DA6|nr:hypothetical protein [Citrobacter sp. Marseille-Q6884]